jgi:uncharacterized protein YndB with AHSA1/START domain
MVMSFAGTLQVTAVGDREVRLVREFDAPLRLVWDCFTKPELVRRWLFGPDGWSFLVCDIDLRVGGSYRYVWRKDESGTEMGMTGVYREIVPHERIVDAQIFDQDWTGGEAIGTVLFIERNGRTTVDNTMLYSSREARDMVLQSGMKEGMAMGYDRLEEFMATRRAGGAA